MTYFRCTHPRSASGAARVLCRAFSMIELVVVMTIIALVAAVATPRFAAAQSQYRVQNAASRLAADYIGLRATAMSQSATALLSASSGSDVYKLSITALDASGVAQSRVETVQLGVEPYVARFLAVTQDSGSGLGFDAYGNAAGAGKAALRSGWTMVTVGFDADGGVTVGAPRGMSQAQRAAAGVK